MCIRDRILHGPTGLFPPYVLGLATGIASGAAMLPYSVIKEALSLIHI